MEDYSKEMASARKEILKELQEKTIEKGMTNLKQMLEDGEDPHGHKIMCAKQNLLGYISGLLHSDAMSNDEYSELSVEILCYGC